MFRMNSKVQPSILTLVLPLLVVALTTNAPRPASGATVWTGTNITFTQNSPSPSDTITAAVALSRGGNGPLFNTAAGETGSDFVSSPTDTEWAFGSISNYASLTYQPLAAIRNGAVPNFSAAILNQPMVLHLISENIYLSIKFTSWGRFFAGGFSYTRSTPAPVAPTPNVSITSPTNGATFTAPATLQIDANATVAAGSVTNVSFFANGNFLGSDLIQPFSVSSGSLSVGAYGLTAIATAAGVASTSSVVNISVLAPGAITLSAPKVTGGLFTFDYTASPGLNYVVENSADLVNWQPLVTNTATSNPSHYTNAFIPNTAWYYRVGRLTGP
jgi:hypothetical protein